MDKKIRYGVIAILVIAVITLCVHQVNEDMEFSCVAANHYLQEGEDIYGVAGKYCTGNRQSAVQYIMDINGIKSNDLGNLQAHTYVRVEATK